MRPQLPKESALQALADFFRRTRPLVLFGTGLSCAVDTRFGMPALSDHLSTSLDPGILSSAQAVKEWDEVQAALREGRDLESALDMVVDEALAESVTSLAAQFVSVVDAEYSERVLTGATSWPALTLFRRLVSGLSPTERALEVATTNYDLLAEYAFSFANLPYTTGFSGGVVRRLDWRRVDRSFSFFERRPVGRRTRATVHHTHHIRLHRVHGSLNTFALGNEIVENDLWAHSPPRTVHRVMIAPGSRKYEELHRNRSELLGEYDRAVEEHECFLFLGFGFNDTQLNNAAVQRKLREQGRKGLIVTRDSNDRIESVLEDCEDVWLVCRHSEGGTRIANAKYEDLRIPTSDLWMFDRFADEVLGG